MHGMMQWFHTELCMGCRLCQNSNFILGVQYRYTNREVGHSLEFKHNLFHSLLPCYSFCHMMQVICSKCRAMLVSFGQGNFTESDSRLIRKPRGMSPRLWSMQIHVLCLHYFSSIACTLLLYNMHTSRACTCIALGITFFYQPYVGNIPFLYMI